MKMSDITYCVSNDCKNRYDCQRHTINNNLKGKIYSVSDFTSVNKDCEFYIASEKLKCEHCNAELCGEVQFGQLGLGYIHCNECGEDSYNEELDEITLTSDNVTFPQHYFNFGYGKKIDNDYINESVRKGLKYLEENPNEDFCQLGTGDTNITIVKYEGDKEYCVIVSKNYYETFVPFNVDK